MTETIRRTCRANGEANFYAKRANRCCESRREANREYRNQPGYQEFSGMISDQGRDQLSDRQRSKRCLSGRPRRAFGVGCQEEGCLSLSENISAGFPDHTRLRELFGYPARPGAFAFPGEVAKGRGATSPFRRIFRRVSTFSHRLRERTFWVQACPVRLRRCTHP
jgi:hypothetical protein